jgi:hypothetical protein
MKAAGPRESPPDLQLSVDRIRIAGAPPALRDTAAFSRALDEALSRALGATPVGAGQVGELGTLKVRVLAGAGIRQIADTVARTMARAIGGG